MKLPRVTIIRTVFVYVLTKRGTRKLRIRGRRTSVKKKVQQEVWESVNGLELCKVELL